MKPPCGKDCQDRHIGCHGTCEKYLAFRAERDEELKRRQKEYDTLAYVVDGHVKARIRYKVKNRLR